MRAWILAIFAAVAPLTLHAFGFYELCCSGDCCFNASLGIEGLYWRPCTDDFVYGQQLTTTTSSVSNLIALEPEYDWGFRLFATVSDKCECNIAEVEWVRVNSDFSAGNTPDQGFDLNAFVFDGGNVTSVLSLGARQTTHYQKVSARLNHRLLGQCCRYFYGYLGGRWIHIHVKQFTRDQFFSLVEQKTSFDGGGVEVGIGGYADLWCGFGTSLRFGGIGAIGDRAFTLHGGGPDTTIEGKDTKCKCVGAFEIRADVHYTHAYNCLWVRANVGYELDYYSSAILFARGQSFPSEQFASDFGIGGLVVGLTVGY